MNSIHKKVTKKIRKKAKGDAMILLSIAITGLVMMVSVIAIEKLKQSTKLQNTQKISLQNTYQAEEGIEFSLFTTKQGVTTINDQANDPKSPLKRFQVSLWEGTGVKTQDVEALNKMTSQTSKDRFVISSKNKITDTNSGSQQTDQAKKLEKSAFSNVPSRFYDQVSVWNNLKDYCNAENGATVCPESDLTIDKTYQVVAKVAKFDTKWTSVKYRLIFRCFDLLCSVKDLRIGYGNCSFTGSTCPMTCDKWTTNNSIKFWGGKGSMLANVVVSDWFTLDSDIRDQKVVIQFNSDKGRLRQVKVGSDQSEILMCKDSEAPIKDKFGGLTKIEVKRN